MKTDVAEELKEVVADLLKEYVPAPWGKLSAVIVSRYGQRPIQYFLPTANATEDIEDQAIEQPNFARRGDGALRVSRRRRPS